MMPAFDLYMILIVLAAAAVTYATRIGGYILITHMKNIPPRLEAALNAVPVAVLTTLVAPAFFDGDWDIKLALIAALFVGLRFPKMLMLVAAWIVVMAWRFLLG